jgi:hypothetical protein
MEENLDKNNMNESSENLSSSDLSQDELRRAVMGEESENLDPYLENAKRIQELTGQEGLGNVKSMRGDDEAINSDMLLGWHPIYIDAFPSEGRFYPDGIKVQIRAARAAEIRHWSTLNERDLYDVDDKLNHIMQNCTRITSEKRMLSWKDILEEDRIFLILAIRDLTFKEGENKISVGRQCPHCGTQNTIDVNNNTLQRVEPTSEIEKYYDPVEKLYNIQTKSYGVIKMKPPTIGVMQVVTKYIKTKQEEGGYFDQSYIQLFPYLYHDWRGLKEKSIFDGEVSFQGWDEKKYMLIYRIAEKMKVGVQPEIKQACTGCGEEVAAKIDFRNGIKAIFIPTISDITEELL